MTDQQQQTRVNEAAEKFTDALVQSYKVVTDRGASPQEQNAQLTEVFVNQTINSLRTQAEQNRQATQRLAEQQQRQADAANTLTRESVDAYMHFMDSMFSWWQGGVQTAERGARETEKATKGQKKS
jgi:predicted RNA polymerase sigma factor